MPASVAASGSSISVFATGTPGTTFSADWNMFLKVGGDSVTPNDTSNGFSAQTLDGMGQWIQLANGNGAMSGQDNIYFGGTYSVEASANLTIETVHSSTTDRRSITVTLVVVAY